MVAPPGSLEAAHAEVRLRDVWRRLPGWAQEVSGAHILACSRGGAEPALYCRWPQAFVCGTAPELQPPGVLVLDNVEPANETTRHTIWRLRLQWCWRKVWRCSTPTVGWGGG